MMAKVAVVIHGYPRSFKKEHPFYGWLLENGYEVISPNLFEIEGKFEIELVIRELKRGLEGNRPELIVGFSMGGLIVPYLAKDYPKAKLILVATGAYFEPRLKVVERLVGSMSRRFRLVLLFVALHLLPKRLLFSIYNLVNPFDGNGAMEDYYLNDRQANVESVLGIPLRRQKEVVNFLANVNNAELLSELGNKALVLSSEDDLLMPRERGEELNRLLKNSELVVTQGQHFDVLGEEAIVKVEEFLRD